MKKDTLFETIASITKPQFCGDSNIVFGYKVRLVNLIGPQHHLNGATGTSTHPFGEVPPKFVGVILDERFKDKSRDGKINIHQDNISFALGAIPAPKTELLKNVNLGQSFEKLKDALRETTHKTKDGGRDVHAWGVGYLQSAIKRHLLECTTISGEELQKFIEQDPNDTK